MKFPLSSPQKWLISETKQSKILFTMIKEIRKQENTQHKWNHTLGFGLMDDEEDEEEGSCNQASKKDFGV